MADVRVSFVESAQGDPGAPPVTAIGLRAAHARGKAAEQSSPPTEVVVLVDTSASQTGQYRRRSLDTLAGVLEGARDVDRFLPAAVDVTCVPLADSFHPPRGGVLRDSSLKLDARTPLGSTDLIAALETAAGLFSPSAKARAIVYIGDGPGLAAIDTADFQRALDILRSGRISFSSVGIGPQVNWPCLAAIASATGGMLLVPDDTVAAKDAGSRAIGMAVAPVAWPEEVALSGGVPDVRLRMLPGRLPPLRTDRDSVVLVEGPLASARIDMALETSFADGTLTLPAKVSIPAAAARAENAFLEELARNARDSDGVFLPLLGREGLELARGAIRGEAATLAALSRQAEASGAHESALRLAEASLRRDPDNVDASIIRSVAQRRETDAGGGEPLPQPQGATGLPAAPAGAEEVAEINAMRRVRAQQLEQEAAVRIRDARQMMTFDPDRARADVKDLQRLVMASDDLDAAMRDRLNRQLEMVVRESIVRSREKVERDLAAERRAAIGRERMRLNSELQRKEDRIKQLTERYNALVEEGIRVGYQRPTTRFNEAERDVAVEIAEEAPDIYANYPVPMTARVIGRTAPLVARILDYDAENMRVRREMQRGFMDSLHLVDVAAIPFPDEPPIIYPNAERWRELTRLREKYKSVDLANPGSSEQRIYEALEKPVERFDFTETPLRDVIAQIEDSQGIPVEIDTKAFEDAGLDLMTPVTKNVSGISLRSALRLLLGELDLTYLVKDEVLLITTKDKAAENLVVKVYPVADLVLPVNPSSGLNPFQTGGGLGGQGGINSGQGGGLGGQGGGGGMGGMGGGMFQISDARARLSRREKPASVPAPSGPSAARQDRSQDDAPRFPATAAPSPQETSGKASSADASGGESSGSLPSVGSADIGLPNQVVEADDLRSALAAYLETEPSARMARLRVTAAELGRQGRFDRAAELISAAIACGHGEPWMYEALAMALEAAGRPREDVERALLSSADFASTPVDLLALAQYLARFGSVPRAIRICRQVTTVEPANREAYALAMSLAAGSDDVATLRWACPGVLSHEWPLDHQEIALRAARLARASIEKLEKAGKAADATAFRAAVDEALVRDIDLDLSWNGDADIDLIVEEPPGTVCSQSSPRSSSGGTLLAEAGNPSGAGGDPVNSTQRERYVAAQAFPGTYRILVRRAWGKVAADTLTAELTLHRGTDREQKLRRQLPLGADEMLLTVELPEGRRREPLLDAQIAQDVAVQQNLGRAILAQQLAGITDPTAAASLSQSRTATGGQPVPGLPFFRSGAAGYQPVITTLPEGVNLFARAVVSADRRYVRITCTPLFSGVGQVTQFNFSGAGAQGTGSAGGGGAGGGGAGGAGGGAGGAGGGAGGAGGGAGGAGGGAGGAGGGAAGGAGGAGGGAGGQGGFCWVAREVYGVHDPRWLLFRHWLHTEAPRWLHDLYASHGEAFAAWIHDKPVVKSALRTLMDQAISPCPPLE